MKLLTRDEMKACDEATFAQLGVTSRAVMESAGRAVATVLLQLFPSPRRVCVLAGSGNNGGDAFVVARVLHQLGWEVVTCCTKPLEELRGDAAANAQSLVTLGAEVQIVTDENWTNGELQGVIRAAEVCIDGLYGTGFHGKLTGVEEELAQFLNAGRELGDTLVVAIDMPSGVDASTGAVSGEAIQADYTVTFQFPKLGQLLFPGALHVGELYVVDIGLWSESPGLRSVHRELVEQTLITPLYRRALSLPADSHKGQRGHVFVVGGAEGHYGAPTLSAQAALKSGAGLVTMGLSREGISGSTRAFPELMTLTLGTESEVPLSPSTVEALNRFCRERLDSHPASMVVGPGLGTSARSESLLQLILETARGFNIPVILDADGLNILAAHPELWQLVSPQTILTPHPGEMARLTGLSTHAIQNDRPGTALRLSKERRCWVILKGARTIIAGPLGELYVNPTVTPVLATAGSGDVLAGIIGAFVARGSSPGEGALLGVFFHGEVGESFGTTKGGVTASDLIAALPKVIDAFCERDRRLMYPVIYRLVGADFVSEQVGVG